MNTAQKAIKAFEESVDFDNVAAIFEAESFGTRGRYNYAVFADGSAIKSCSDYDIEECGNDEAIDAIEQQ
ncbi:hypothetical protein ACQE3E_23215 (plasmid) [Methylomonas sp. MED-D]|uniref:hypothetical protein n=1 Tax=Methylomonas sp. MED-D TaxID=3418768 RepID=UPI003D086554